MLHNYQWTVSVTELLEYSSLDTNHHNLHMVNTHPMHVIAPNRIWADPPEDGQVTPETFRGIDS
jgi:hypothetical protein